MTKVPIGNIAKIKTAANTILREVGLRFEGDPETLEIWYQQGAKVEGERVFLDGDQLTDIIRKSAPREFGMRGGKPEFDCLLGENHAPVCAPIYGAPNVMLKDGTRSVGTRALYQELLDMAAASETLKNTGHMICVMDDVPEAERPVEMVKIHLEASDKPLMGSVASPAVAVEVRDMVAARRQAGSEDRRLESQMSYCNLLYLINATPPLVYQSNPLKCLRAVAQMNEASIITSYMMMGATAPVTAAGALAQGYAECLAGMALSQLWSPGAPIVMGLIGNPFAMDSMQPFFGDPVSNLIQSYAVALARDLGVPVRADGGATSAKVDDAQAGYESARATQTAFENNSDLIMHATGWLENGRCVSFSKFAREVEGLHQFELSK